MIDCPRCTTPNQEAARFCSSCGESLVSRIAVHERRVVTVLFADLARSTSMGERLDPEVMRGLVGRFFEMATAAIEERGGAVEKFSGDAVVAVFGLRQAHEDDPERAVRAAFAIHAGLTAIADDARARHGVAVQARVGIESGEVVVGDPFGGGTLATGDAMNLAARLEQQAEPGEVVIGQGAWEAVRSIVAAEPLGELAIRGHAAPLRGWRATAISSEVGRPRGVPGLEAPLTGRDEELNLLLDAARRAQQERKATLFTILGVPGVGKSRLVREATARLTKEGWSVLSGRCLPYGDGITYWPVAEMVRGLAGIEANTSPEAAQAALAAISREPEVAGPLATALGSRDASQQAAAASDSDVSWAFRQLIERIAADRPQVLVFEDIHWAEPPLLDLIEYLVTWTREAPVLVICPSRPELLDLRPAWGGGRMESARIQLEPLSEAESRSMLSALLAVDDLPAALRQRVLDRAEGNPLFVEEVVRLLIEEGTVEQRDGRWHARAGAVDVRIPDNVEALIRARLDTLPAQERLVLQSASVVGRVFQKSAVRAIHAPSDGGGIQGQLDDAVLRDLITRERSVDLEPTFRFRHILIRDVAYNTLPKARRAELHDHVATWLRSWAGPRIDEFVEIEAYHLEQAVTLRRELDGKADAASVQRAVRALAASGSRALSRDDERTALGFAERAVALDPPPGEDRLEIEWLRVEALRRLGDLGRAEELAVQVERDAEALGRRDIQGRAVLARGQSVWLRRTSGDLEAGRGLLEQSRQLLADAGDTWYLSSALGSIAFSVFWEGDLRRSGQLWAEFAELCRSNGWPSREALGLVRQARMRREFGDMEIARRQLTEATRLAESGPSRRVRVHVQSSWAQLKMLEESFENAEPEFQAAARAYEELGDREAWSGTLSSLGFIELCRDRPAEALAYFRKGSELVADDAGAWPEFQRLIAQALLDMGQIAEGASAAEQALAGTAPHDVVTISSSSMALGRARAAQGRDAEAEELLKNALALEQTEYNPWEQQLSLAEFLLSRGRSTEGSEWLVKARASASRYGPSSPLIGYVDRRGERAASGGMTST